MHRRFQDLNQDDPFVRSTLLQWAATLKHIGFDGVRIDTVPEVKPSFWSEFTQAVGMYTVGISLAHFYAVCVCCIA
jgi:glycosidase